MVTLNRLSIIGRIGSSKVLEFEGSPEPVTSISVAVDNSYKDKSDQWVEKTQWYEVLLKGDRSSTLVTGRSVLVEGRPEAEAYLKDGQPVAVLKIKGATLRFLDKKPQEEIEGEES